MYKLYKKINEFGLQDFLDIVNSKNIKYIGKISNLNDLNKIKDVDMLQICHEIGFYDQNVKGLLQIRSGTRNAVAHVSQVKLNPYTVFEFVNDVCEYTQLIAKVVMRPDPNLLDTIRSMDESNLKQMITRITFSKLKSYTGKIFDRLAEIKVYEEFQENANLYLFVTNGTELRESEQERVELFEILFKRGLFNKISWGSWQFTEKIFDLTKFSYIRKYILDCNYLDQLIGEFSDSNSFESAGVRIRGIANFIDDLNDSQIDSIARAWLRNGQISASYTATPYVTRVLLSKKNRIKHDTLSLLRSNGMEI